MSGRDGQPSSKEGNGKALSLRDYSEGGGNSAGGKTGYINHAVTRDVESGEDEAGAWSNSAGHTHPHTPSSLLAKASSALLQESTSLSWFCPSKCRITTPRTATDHLYFASLSVEGNAHARKSTLIKLHIMIFFFKHLYHTFHKERCLTCSVF